MRITYLYSFTQFIERDVPLQKISFQVVVTLLHAHTRILIPIKKSTK